MDRATAEVYEREAGRWIADRTPKYGEAAARFGDRIRAAAVGGAAADLGCGPGWYTNALPSPTVALDVADAMLRATARRAPHALLVRGDLEALPLRPGSLGGAWACRTYVHVARTALPLALAQLHRALRVGAPVELLLFGGDLEHGELAGDDFPGRRFSAWSPAALHDVVVGAGFEYVDIAVRPTRDVFSGLTVTATRARSLPDTVAPGMRLLVCGLNPSLRAADAGVGYVTAGNRFWPAAVAAGLVTRDRDPWHALSAHHVGITDLVKRASPRAAELTADELRAGMARVERLVRWLQPAAVCFVGLAGWRATFGRRARTGVQDRALGGRPVYVMPSTSGLNARTTLPELVEHVRRAAALADAHDRPVT